MKKFHFAKMTSYAVPEFKEVRIGDFINYGDAKIKSYPDYWIGLYYGSPKHSAIINARHKYVMGGGWSVTATDTLQKAKAQEIINYANPSESLNEVTRKCELDRLNTGGFALEVIRSKDKKTIATIYHIDIAKVKIGISGKNKDGTNIYRYCYLPDWKGVTRYDVAKSKEGFKEWNLFWEDLTAESSIYYYKPHRLLKDGEVDAYPVPDWISSCGYIEADREIEKFHVNNIKNNFWGGQIVEMTNVFSSEDERDAFIKDFQDQKTGAENAGETMFIFTNEKDSVKSTPLSPSELDKQFDLLNKSIRQELALSHRINLKLIGNELESQAFSRTEFFDLYDLYYSTQVLPEQMIWNEIINYIYSFNGFSSNAFKLEKLQLIQSTSKSANAVLDSLNSLSPLVANKVLESMNSVEIRSLIGLQGVMEERKIFSKTLSTFEQFEHIGEYVSEDRIVSSYKVDLDEEGNPLKTNEQFAKVYFSEILGMDISKVEADILSAIQKNPKMSIEDLSDAFGLKVSDMDDIVSSLKRNKILTGNIGENAKISKKATSKLNENDVILDIEVKYRYSDKGAPKLSKGGESRDFCKKMMVLSKSGKMYSRKEIDSVRNDQDENKNAWLYRGGFYTNPKTNEITPYCRHFWESVIIKTKR